MTINNQSILLTTFIFLLLTATSCIKEPTLISINNFQLKEVVDDELLIEMSLTVFNNNRFGGEISKSESKVYINDEFIGIAKNNNKFNLKSKSESDITLNMQMSLNQLTSNFEEYITNTKKSQITIDGIYWISFGSKSFQIKSKSKQEIKLRDELLKVIETNMKETGMEISKLRPKSISFKNTEFDITVNIKNPFPIDYEILDCQFDILLAKTQDKIGTWNISGRKKILAKESTQIKGLTKISNLSALSQLKTIFINRNVDMLANGSARIKVGENILDIPIEHKIEF